MTMDEARKRRRELIKERQSQVDEIQSASFERGQFEFKNEWVSTIGLQMTWVVDSLNIFRTC